MYNDFKNICKYTASCASDDKARNSASPVDRAVTRCSLDTQDMGAHPKKMIHPVEDVQVLLPFQSLSQYAEKHIPPNLEMLR